MADGPKKHRLLTIEQAAEDLNVSIVRSALFCERGSFAESRLGRVAHRAYDIENSLSEAYKCTAVRIAAGELKDDPE